MFSEGIMADFILICFLMHRHSIKANVWSNFKLNQSSGASISIREAIEEWYTLKSNTTLHYRDECQGPHCNNACPEMFILDDLVSDIWRTTAKGFIILIVVGVALFCVTIKVIFTLWLWKLEWRQHLYLGLLGDESRTCDIETALQVRLSNHEIQYFIICLCICSVFNSTCTLTTAVKRSHFKNHKSSLDFYNVFCINL